MRLGRKEDPGADDIAAFFRGQERGLPGEPFVERVQERPPGRVRPDRFPESPLGCRGARHGARPLRQRLDPVQRLFDARPAARRGMRTAGSLPGERGTERDPPRPATRRPARRTGKGPPGIRGRSATGWRRAGVRGRESPGGSRRLSRRWRLSRGSRRRRAWKRRPPRTGSPPGRPAPEQPVYPPAWITARMSASRSSAEWT